MGMSGGKRNYRIEVLNAHGGWTLQYRRYSSPEHALKAAVKKYPGEQVRVVAAPER